MRKPTLQAVRDAVEELETIALLLRTTEITRQAAGLTLVGPGVARMLEGCAARILDSLPPPTER